jgi:hypothetical protein
MLDAAPDRLSRWLVDQDAELGVPLAYVGSAQSVAYVPTDPPADEVPQESATRERRHRASSEAPTAAEPLTTAITPQVDSAGGPVEDGWRD